MNRPALPRASSATSGFFFCGQHRAAGGVRVGEGAEPELLGRPQHDLLAHPREVDAEQGDVEEGLGDEVAVRHRVERVLEPGVEAELLGDEVRVEGQRRPGQGPRPERRDVHPLDRRDQPVDVPCAAPSRARAGGGPAGPAGPAADACSRAGRRRPASVARPSRTSWRAMTSVAMPVSRRRHHSRRSVATWSFRLRPVWSLAPTSPASSVTRRSMAVWTSSSSGREHEAVLGDLLADPVERRRAGSSTSRSSRIPLRPSPRTWAREPARSSAAERPVEPDAHGELRHHLGHLVAESVVPQRHRRLSAAPGGPPRWRRRDRRCARTPRRPGGGSGPAAS